MNPNLDGGKILIDAHAFIRLLDFHDRAVSVAEDAAQSQTAPIGLREKAKALLAELDNVTS
jgi:hypothetical protein